MSADLPDPPPAVSLAIFARAPQAGATKTRLIPALGAEGAARLHRWLLRRTVHAALESGIGPVTLWCAGDPAHADFAWCQRLGPVRLCVQPEGDLGARMYHALAAPPPGIDVVAALVIGSDCPELDAAHLRRAARVLATHDAVLLPAHDGGYVAIGMRSVAEAIFADVAWGSGEVLAQTRSRLTQQGWRWLEPAIFHDVDRPDDLPRLFERFPEARAFVGCAKERA